MRKLAMVLAGTGLLLGACGGRAGEVVRPKDFTAANALGGPAAKCSAENAQLAKPLIIDLDADARVDLEAAMTDKKKPHLVVVAYDCVSIRVLANCHTEAETSYDYAGVQRKEQVVQMKGADELKVNLPLSVGRFGSDVQAGRSIDLGLVYVGKRSTVVGKVNRDELSGECEGATHYLHSASVGAFSMATGSEGKVVAVGDLFRVASAAGKSESAKKVDSFDGSLAACRTSKPSSPEPPEECGAPIRVEIHPIAAGSKSAGKASNAGKEKEDTGPEPEEIECRPGLHYSDGVCVKDSATGHLCKRDDIEGCRTQCEKGNAGSCFNLGFITSDDEKLKAYKRGCDLGHADSCAEQGIAMNHGSMLLKSTGKEDLTTFEKATAIFDHACEMGSGWGCWFLGMAVGDENSAATHNLEKGFKAFERACLLGSAEGCTSTAKAYLAGEGTKKDTKKGIDFFAKACQSGKIPVCVDFARVLRFGSNGAPTDIDRAYKLLSKLCVLSDPETQAMSSCHSAAEVAIELNHDEEAAEHAKKACPDEKESSARLCTTLAALYSEGRGGVKKNEAAAQAIYKRACDERERDACKKVKGGASTPKPKATPKKKR